MTKKLKDIRKKIDALDNKIHDVLMERAALIVDVAEEKRRHGIQYVQPAREAKMIRRLLARHEGALPEAAVVRIWRELVGAVSLMQTGLRISVASGGNGGNDLWDMARNYFGSVVPMQKISSPLAAIGSVREGEASFAVLPWPSDEDKDPWWVYLFNLDEPIRIVSALPYGFSADYAPSGYERALTVSKVDYSPSGDDRSFIALQLDQSVSRGRIVEILKDLKMETLGLSSKIDQSSPYSFHLAEVGGYIGENDKELEKLKVKLMDGHVKCRVLGGYPAPPVFGKKYQGRKNHV